MKDIEEVIDLWKKFEARASAKRSRQIERVKEDRRFLAGTQWDRNDNRLYPKGRTRRVINVLGNSIQSTVNSYSAYPYLPYSPIGESDKAATAFMRAGQNARAPYDALYSSVAFGLGYMAIGSDTAYDKATGQNVNVPALYAVKKVENVYFDPDSQNCDGSDAVEAGLVEYRSKSWVRMKYGEEFASEDGVRAVVNTKDNGNSDTMVIVTYFRLEDGQVTVYRLLNDRFLEDPVVLNTNRIPVFPVYGSMTTDDSDDIIYEGLVRRGREIQRTINQAFSQLTERLAMAPKPTFLTRPEAIEGYEDGYRNFQYNINPIALYNAKDPKTKEEFAPPTRIDNTVQFGDITGIISANLELLSTITGVDAKGLVDTQGNITATQVIYDEHQTQCTIRHFYQNLKDSMKAAFTCILQLLGKDASGVSVIQGPVEAVEKQTARQELMQIAALVPEQNKMKVVDGILLSHNENPILQQVFGMLHSSPEPSAMEAQAFETIEQMKQAIIEKNQQIQQLTEDIKKLEQNASNNDKGILADLAKMRLKHEQDMESMAFKAQLDNGIDADKERVELQKAELDYASKALQYDTQKVKSASEIAKTVGGIAGGSL